MDEQQRRTLEDFGARLREVRLLQSVSQEGLAHTAGVDRTYVSGIERGRRNPTVLTICKLAAALGVSPADLLLPPEDRR